MAKKIYRSGGFMVVDLGGGDLRQIPIASFSYLFVGTDIHMVNEAVARANYTESIVLLEDQAGGAIGNQAAVAAYLDARSNATFPVTSAVVPTINDDDTLGYFIGARWVDEVLVQEHVCLDATTGAAVWKQTT